MCLYVLPASFLSEPDAPSAMPVAPAAVMSPRGVVRLSMLLAAERQDGDGDGEMTTPPGAPVLTTVALTWHRRKVQSVKPETDLRPVWQFTRGHLPQWLVVLNSLAGHQVA